MAHTGTKEFMGLRVARGLLALSSNGGAPDSPEGAEQAPLRGDGVGTMGDQDEPMNMDSDSGCSVSAVGRAARGRTPGLLVLGSLRVLGMMLARSRRRVHFARAASGALSLSIAAIATLLQADAARADCVSPPFEVLWTYPEDGATDVPTNAIFWMSATGWSARPVATLNGAVLDESVAESFASTSIDPGPLEPDTDYTLELEFAAVLPGADGGTDQTLEIEFRTGAGPAQEPAAPAVPDHDAVMGYPSEHACENVIAAQDCFDTGQNTLYSFNAKGAGAIAWLVQTDYLGSSTLWPESCGVPSVYTYPQPFGEDCYEVSVIGEGGLRSDSTKYCAEPPSGSDSDAATEEASDPPPRSDSGSGMDTDAAAQQERARKSPPNDDGGCSVVSALGSSGDRHGALAATLGLALVGWVCVLRRCRH